MLPVLRQDTKVKAGTIEEQPGIIGPCLFTQFHWFWGSVSSKNRSKWSEKAGGAFIQARVFIWRNTVVYQDKWFLTFLTTSVENQMPWWNELLRGQLTNQTCVWRPLLSSNTMFLSFGTSFPTYWCQSSESGAKVSENVSAEEIGSRKMTLKKLP